MNSKLTFRLVLATSIFCGTVALQIEPLAKSLEPGSAVMDPLVDEKLASVLEALQGLSIDPGLRAALEPELQNNPTLNRFPVALDDGQRIVLVCEMVGKQSNGRFLPQKLSRLTTIAVAELVRLDATVEILIARGLDDRQAAEVTLQRAARNEKFVGSVTGLSSLATREDGAIVAVAWAKQDSIKSAWQNDDAVELLNQIYRETLQRRYFAAMENRKWDDSLKDIEHLISKKGLAAPNDYLNAAKCYRQTDRKYNAQEVLTRAMILFATQADWQYFEKVGNELLELELDTSEVQAEKAFELALERLQKTPR